MNDRQFVNKLVRLVRRSKNEGLERNYSHPTGIEGLEIVYTTHPTPLQPVLYEPVVCLVLQGMKETFVGTKHRMLKKGDSLIVSHDLPVISRVTSASEKVPYVSVVMKLNMPLIATLVQETDLNSLQTKRAQSIDVGVTPDKVLDLFPRMIDLIQEEDDKRVLLPLLQKELHYRLLQAQHGEMLRQLRRADSHASRIAIAVNWLRENYMKPLSVPQLANKASMSLSSFHYHFKSITEVTPLQYQKNLRLIESRRLLLSGKLTVSTAAFTVGYESVSQFSREYSRMFGISPSKDFEIV